MNALPTLGALLERRRPTGDIMPLWCYQHDAIY
jgi:hypothetical protein